MGAAEAAGGKVAEDLLVKCGNIVDAETFEEEASDANREDADKERDEGKRKMEREEEKRNQDNKRRRLQLFATEKCLDKFPEGCLHGPCRHDLNRFLCALKFGPTTKEGCTVDASGIINAVQGADRSPHEEDAKMERWRMMYGGMELWDDVTDRKPLNWRVGSTGQKAGYGILQEDGRVKESTSRRC